jgi:Fe-S cluster biogenesis protein NfuA
MRPHRQCPPECLKNVGSRQTVGVPEELTEDERRSRMNALNSLLDLMRPSVQADGGDLVLIRADLDAGVVEVQLRGACSSCAISSSTLQGGVTRILTDRLPWVTEVIGGLDESVDEEDSFALGRGAYIPRYRA